MKNQGGILLSDAHSEVALAKVFEVFLSFCGKDTRNGFTDFLYTYLKDASIQTFRDDNELRLGERISPELLKAIRESKISIPVFSKNYACSKWCLLELAEMVDCHKNGGHMIYPIFYDITPFEVRHQYGSYDEAFQEHEKKFDNETVKRWKEALITVGELKGLELKQTNGQEGKLVKMVVEKVLLHLKKNYTVLPENLVGMEMHTEILKELLQVGIGGARVVVIHGMGGLGKTTIAKVIFNQLHDMFDNHCFLDDVREKSEHRDGIFDLQNKLISKINNRGSSKISDANVGRGMIKDTVSEKKVLLVLDDVDKISQVNMLMGNLSWYGAQSRIIITTRDTIVLSAIKKTCQIVGLNDVCTGYNPSCMKNYESLQLFSKYAFMRDCPPEGYERLSEEVISIAAGLPLVLVVLGSTFFVVEGTDLWNEKLRKLRKMPNEDVLDKLRFSFNALENGEKQIFLDIACLFIGWDVTRPSYMWDDCGFYPRDGINVLVRKSLITVCHNILIMHDQLRDLGRQIVREESLNELGKQSRLWCREEAMRVLETIQGTASVDVLCLPYSQRIAVRGLYLPVSESPVLASSLGNIRNLRYLSMGCRYLDGDFKGLLLGLRWLTMSSFKKGSSTNLHLKNLVILNLTHSDFVQEFRDFKIGENLKVLELSECHSVKVLPDLSRHPSLEILSLSCCDSLYAIDGLEKLKYLRRLDIGECPALEKVCLSNLTNLCKLDLQNCNQLSEIKGLEDLESLQDLLISECSSLEELQDLSDLKMLEYITVSSNLNLIKIKGLEKLELLRGLSIDNCTSLEMLPDFSNLKRLEFISVYGCEKLIEIKGLDKVESLQGLDISECKSLERLPDLSNLKRLETITAFGCSKLIEITGLEKLVLFKNLSLQSCKSLERLPDMSNFDNVQTFVVEGSKKLVEIVGLNKLEKLEDLWLRKCRSLERLPDLSHLKKLKTVDLDGCVKLLKIEGLEKLELLVNLFLGNCRSLERLPDLSNLKKLKTFNVCGCVKLIEIKGLEKLESLEYLQTEDCRSLIRLPDLSSLKKLLKLMANGCTSLVEVKGLDKLESLRFLELRECISLQNTMDMSNLDEFEVFHVPTLELTSFTFLKKVKEVEITLQDNLLKFQGLNVNGCRISGESMIGLVIDRTQDLVGLDLLRKIHIFQELIEIRGLNSLEFLTVLRFSQCSYLKRLSKLPNFRTLKTIKLENCGELEEVEGHMFLESLERMDITCCDKIMRIPDLRKLKNLKHLNLSYLKLVSIYGLDELRSLEYLRICGCMLIETLPDLSNLENLIFLDASFCAMLTEILGLEKMKSLKQLKVGGCKSIVTLPDLSNLKQLEYIFAYGCVRLCKITGLEELASLNMLDVAGCESLERLTVKSILRLPDTIIVLRTSTFYPTTTIDWATSSETSETSTSSMTDDWVNSVFEQGETSSLMPELKEDPPQTSLELGLTSSSEETPNQIMPENTSKRKRI